MLGDGVEHRFGREARDEDVGRREHRAGEDARAGGEVIEWPGMEIDRALVELEVAMLCMALA